MSKIYMCGWAHIQTDIRTQFPESYQLCEEFPSVQS